MYSRDEQMTIDYDRAHTCGCGHSKAQHYDGGCQVGQCKCDEFEPGPIGMFEPEFPGE